MPFSYRDRMIADGDKLDPRDWTRAQKPLVGVINGGIDRENLPHSVLTGTHLKLDTFNDFYQDASTTLFLVSADKTSQWLKTDYSSPAVTLNNIAATVDVDSLLIVEWSGTWHWDQSAMTGSGFTQDDNVVGFRVTVNGIKIAEIRMSSQIRALDTGYMVGALPVSAG